MKRFAIYLLSVTVISTVLAALIAKFGSSFVPVQGGTAEEFWQGAMGVATQGYWVAKPTVSPAYGDFLYSRSHMHGADYYRVSPQDVYSYFLVVIDQYSPDDPEIPALTHWGFARWSLEDPTGHDVNLLLCILREERHREWMRRLPDAVRYIQDDDMEFGLVSQRMAEFPLLRFGEWLYFTIIVAFVLRPLGHQHRRTFSIIWRIAISPLLFLLPFYFGYCSWTFTSYGPGGGVIYPYVLWVFQFLPWTGSDTILVRNVPQILHPLTGPHGPILSISGRRAAGPLSTITFGLLLAATYVGFTKLIDYLTTLRKKKPLPN